MLYSALDALYRRKMIETSYKDVKIVKSVSAKYPFFPLFTSKYNAMGEGLEPGGVDDEGSGTDDDFVTFDDHPTTEGAPTTTSAAAGAMKGRVSSNSSADGSTKSLHTMTDWTDSSSMLPSFVKERTG